MKLSKVFVCCFAVLLALPQLSLAQNRWSESVISKPGEWYATDEALQLAKTLLAYQSPEGGWPKNTNLFAKPPAKDVLVREQLKGNGNSLDNGATTLPIRFLAKQITARHHPELRAALDRGIDYLLKAQYPNGGWPQFFPLRDGYYSHITYNDGAMIRVMELLKEVAERRPPFEFVSTDQQMRAANAIERGLDCILKTQYKQQGRLTVWCAQHDVKTLQPAWARAYEIPSLSGSESVGIVEYLMKIENPSSEVQQAVRHAAYWFNSVPILGQKMESFRNDQGRRDYRLVPDANAKKLWARFYELESNRPIFVGRDKIVRYNVSEIEQERRSGYAYLGTWPESLLERQYPQWCRKHQVKPLEK